MAHGIRSLWRGIGPASIRPIRRLHASPTLKLPDKDTQDRNSLKPRSYEGTSSAYDADVAAQHDAAFNPKKTSPEAEKETAGVGNKINPLEASGANQELSKPMGDGKEAFDTGPGRDLRHKERSHGGSGEKRGSPGRVRKGA